VFDGSVVIKAIVVGSINRDIVAYVATHPRPGETVLAQRGALFAGGKGANQAVAIARLGGAVSFVGRVGADAFGREMLAYMSDQGIDTSAIEVVANAPTGLGLITVDATGQNVITVVCGANISWDDATFSLHAEPGDLVVCQLEIPLAIVARAFADAKRAGATTILNAAPFQSLRHDILTTTDILVVNEHELEALCPGKGGGDVGQLSEAAAAVLALGPKAIVVTLGARGAFVQHADRRTSQLAGRRLVVKDTTGAGDCFVGALAAELMRGRDLHEAAVFANAAAGLSVTREGAANSIPLRAEVEGLLTASSVAR
jgi:ribokinase